MENKKFTFESFKLCFSTIASKVLNIPLTNTINMVEGIFKGENIDKLINNIHKND